MQKIKAKSAFEIAAMMIDAALDGKYAYAILYFDAAAALIRNLLGCEGATISSISISDPEYYRYSKEYYVSLDPEFVVSCEPAWHEKNEYHDAGYTGFDADIVYVDGEAKAKILESCTTKAAMFELDLTECDLDMDYDIDYENDEDGCECDCDDCKFDANMNDRDRIEKLLKTFLNVLENC